MTTRKPESSARSRQRQRALQRWENEGGASDGSAGRDVVSGDTPGGVPPLTNAELVQLQIRVIALENLVIAMFSQLPDRQIELAREMAEYISPRPGSTPHRLTIHAAAQMISLVERAGGFRSPEDAG
ncbi:MAG: hypothetical protein ACXWJ7_17095 [Caldimonas sp.]